MKFYFRYFSVCLFFGTQYISAIAQDNIKDVNSCLCFYFNRIHGDDNFINYGLYDTAILKTLYDPTSVLQDSILFFSPFQSKRLFLEKQIALYHLNDVPDFRYCNFLSLRAIIDGGVRSDSITLLNQIDSASAFITLKYNFEILSWMDRRPFFYSPNRISDKKGIYIKCRPIKGTWYFAKYSSLQSKLIDVSININHTNPEFIKQMKKTVRIAYKDSCILVYPIKIK